MKPHKHKDLIIAWANGAKVQVYRPFDEVWKDCEHPFWDESSEYRIKPQEDSLQKEKSHWKNGGDVQYYNPYEKQWFDVINKPNCEPDWNGLFTIWRIKPEEFKWKKEKEHWENGGIIQFLSKADNKWVDYPFSIRDFFCSSNYFHNQPYWGEYEWRIKPELKIEYTFNDQVKEDIKNVIIKVEDKTKLSIEINFN